MVRAILLQINFPREVVEEVLLLSLNLDSFNLSNTVDATLPLTPPHLS